MTDTDTTEKRKDEGTTPAVKKNENKDKDSTVQKAQSPRVRAPQAGRGLRDARFARYLAELCGTALAVFVTLVAGALTTLTSDLTLVALAAFAGYAAASYVFGRVSGAHLNPAVTLSAALTGRLGWLDALGYLVAQVLGGILAAAAVIPVVNSMADWYMTRMQSSGQQQQAAMSVRRIRQNFWSSVSNGYGTGAGHTMGTNLTGAVILELVASLIIVMVAMRAIRSNGVARNNSWLLTGTAYAAGSVATVAFTGSALNPARATGAAIMAAANGSRGAIRQLWVFWVVPLLAGALVGLVLVIAESAHENALAKRAAGRAAEGEAAHPASKAPSKAASSHKSDEERDIHDFNTVLKQDTASSQAGKADESVNIDFAGKNSSEGKKDDSGSHKSGE